MASRTSRRAMLVVLVVLILAVLVPPYLNVNRYRRRVADSIGRALDRDVTVSRIELQLLPRPGLILSNFEVADDPSYGSEPMLRAESVTALLRLTSLWRGRLEIGTLDIDSPSLNLVRRNDGHWNMEELVERSAQVPSAPTSKARPGTRPRFPYVKASAGRINFKLGDVKKAFALTDADFGLWLDSENEWGVRLEGKPTRTDVGVNDTGLVRMEGTFRRAESLSSTPVSIRIAYSEGQLGQITKLFFARDRGWRGGVSSSAILSGTPAQLNVTLETQVDDFRRYDIALGEALRLRVHCNAVYSSSDDSVRDLQCQSPVGTGLLQLRGTAQGWLAETCDLGISGEQIPVDRIVAFARHAKKDLPSDLTAAGVADAVFTVRRSPGAEPVWSGGGSAKDVTLRAGVLKIDLQLGEVQFAIPAATQPVRTRRGGKANVASPPAALRLEVRAFPLSLGGATAATASAVFDRESYTAEVAGDAELSRLMSVAQALGVGTPGVGLGGFATVDLTVSGTWAGFAPPAPAGRIQVRDATAELQGVSEPLQISSAMATISNQQINLTSLNATFNDGPAVAGSASFPVHCTAAETCIVHFDLRTPEVAIGRLNQLLNPAQAPHPWYHLLAVWQQRNDAMLKLHANGHIEAARITVGTVALNNVNGNLSLDAGKAHLDILGADLLGGHNAGAWDADFTQSPPVFTGGGSATKVSMEQVSSLMHDGWGAGTLAMKYALSLKGTTAAALRDSADGSASFTWTNGTLKHVILAGSTTPLAFTTFSGALTLRKGVLQFSDGTLSSRGANYQVKGTAAYDRTVDLRLEHAGGPSYAISGPLDKPRVQAVSSSSTEAQLR